MRYKELKPKLKNFKKILVSGPQRSGTRISAKIISNDLNFKYLDEATVNIRDEEKFKYILENETQFVLQCPGLSHCLHEVNLFDAAVIFIMRKVEDIIESQERIGWVERESNEIEYFNYEKQFNFDIKRKPISKLKYEIWNQFQKPKIDHSFNLSYSSLSNHDLFIPKEKRENFGSWQISK